MSNSRKYKCFMCKKLTSEYESYKIYKYCTSCYVIKEKQIKEYLEFDELYQYVRGTVMGYSKDMALTSQMTMKLKGLSTSQTYYKNNEQIYSNYNFKDILLTYKAKIIEITIANNSINFRNEMHKFNYMLKIVSSSLNDIVIRMQKREQLKEKSKDVEIEDIVPTTFISKNKNTKVQKICEDLW